MAMEKSNFSCQQTRRKLWENAIEQSFAKNVEKAVPKEVSKAVSTELPKEKVIEPLKKRLSNR